MTAQTSAISASMVKDLREKTGAGMMDAKQALVEARGDMDRAIEILRQKGVASAEKKSGRAAAEGMIVAHIAPEGNRGVLVEINCETDFVARGDAFTQLTNHLAAHAFQSNAATVEEMLAESMASHPGQTVSEHLVEAIASIRENLALRRFTRYVLPHPGWIQSYIHTGNKIGVLLEIAVENASVVQTAPFKQLAKDIAMHIASSSPDFVNRNEVHADIIEAEKRIEMGKEDIQSKPEPIREKIVLGRIDKIIAQRVLMEQPFVKDPGKTIASLLEESSKTLGTPITLHRFVRYLLGEGVEKAQGDFVQDVMAQMQQ
jgi:elongation factor Ts